MIPKLAWGHWLAREFSLVLGELILELFKVLRKTVAAFMFSFKVQPGLISSLLLSGQLFFQICE